MLLCQKMFWVNDNELVFNYTVRVWKIFHLLNFRTPWPLGKFFDNKHFLNCGTAKSQPFPRPWACTDVAVRVCVYEFLRNAPREPKRRRQCALHVYCNVHWSNETTQRNVLWVPRRGPVSTVCVTVSDINTQWGVFTWAVQHRLTSTPTTVKWSAWGRALVTQLLFTIWDSDSSPPYRFLLRHSLAHTTHSGIIHTLFTPLKNFMTFLLKCAGKANKLIPNIGTTRHIQHMHETILQVHNHWDSVKIFL